MRSKLRSVKVNWRAVVLLQLVIALAVGAGAGLAWVGRVTLLDDYVRGFALVNALAMRQGPPIPFDAGYTGTKSWRSFGGIEFNSTWMENYVYRIVPYFTTEGIVPDEGIYPTAVAFVPFQGHRAARVLGTALPAQGWVMINDREVSVPYEMDEAEALEVLVHELLHLQGGIFLQGESDEFEAATDAATVEVLAAMCNDGDMVACRAFAGALRSDVASVLIRDLTIVNGEWVYQWFADTFLRTEQERRAAEKRMRYWHGFWDVRMNIINRYGSIPMEKYIGPGVRGKAFTTGMAIFTSSGPVVYGLLKFDDTAILLYRWNLLWLVQGYGGGEP